MGGQVGVLPVPARPAADPAVAADSAGARKYTPRAYIFGRIWKYLRGFRLSSAPYGVLAWVQRPRAPTADSGPAPAWPQPLGIYAASPCLDLCGSSTNIRWM